MGRDELERLVWHAVANGGYYIEIDKESQRSGTSNAKDIEAHGHTGELARLCTARIAGRAIQSHNNEPRERIRTIN